MNKSPFLPLGLAMAVSCLCFNKPAEAQQVGDTFSSSVGDTFSSSAAPDEYYPSAVFAPHVHYPAYRHGPNNGTPIPSSRLVADGGYWQVEEDGEVTFIPNDTGDPGDAFTGVEDDVPPGKTEERFSLQDVGNDEFSTPSCTYAISRGFSKDARKWPKCRMPLIVYVSGTIEKAREGLVKSDINQCLHEWSVALHGRVKYVLTDDFKNADIYFLQRDTSNHEWADNERRYSKQGLDEVRISLLEQTVSYLPEKRLRAVLLHECGHALGLIDHLPDKTDVMSVYGCDSSSPLTQLSEDDKVEMQKLYATSQPYSKDTLLEQSYQRLAEDGIGSLKHAYAPLLGSKPDGD